MHGIRLPPPVRRVSAGCIEAMTYITENVTKTLPQAALGFEQLAQVASFFSSPKRRQLIEENSIPDDPDLRVLLSDWGQPFLICVQAIGSHWKVNPLVSPRIGIAAHAITTGEEWNDKLNARRCELIDRKLQGLLETDELDELIQLQNSLRKHIRAVAPLPLAAARKLHAELLSKQAERRRQS